MRVPGLTGSLEAGAGPQESFAIGFAPFLVDYSHHTANDRKFLAAAPPIEADLPKLQGAGRESRAAPAIGLKHHPACIQGAFMHAGVD